MPQNVTEVDAYTSPVTAAADGDAVNGANFLAVMQGYANRLRFARARAFGAVPSYHFPLQLCGVGLNNFVYTIAGGPGTDASGYAQGATPSAANIVVVPILVPGIGTPTHAPKLTSVKVSVRPANGHGALPATQWGAKVFRQGASGGTSVILAGPTLDTAGTVGAYEALREITLTTNVVLTTSDSYYVTVFGEGGANSIAGLLLTRIGVTIDPE